MGRRDVLYLAGLLVLAAVSFGTGLTWGLPSRDADPVLFGGRRPWTGAEVMALAGPWSPAGDRGSDRPQHAVGPTTGATVLNATDADRAEIVRRFHLYSRQPDEMITFRALSRMRLRPFDLDPRLYQYGGLWVYPVGGLLRLAAAAHLVVLRTDLAFYLDHPEAFARFYVVARLYSAAWGLVGVAVVYGLGRELAGRRLVAVVAAGVYATMPVVVNAAHEAKPHLAGTVLTLATVWAAARYVRHGRRWWLPATLAGAASGMVLTGVAAWAVLPVMVLLRPGRRWRTLLWGAAVAGAVFVATNPYLPTDAVFHRERLASNVGNYGNFYQPTVSVAALLRAGRLLVIGTSPVAAAVAVLGPLSMIRRTRTGGPGWLLAAPCALVGLQFVLLATDKPAEYARFALTLDVGAAVLAAVAILRLPVRPREAALAGGLLVAATALFGLRYDLNAIADTGAASSRSMAAAQLARLARPGRTLAIGADPAPYRLPPVDLFAWRIVRRPAALPADAVNVDPTDDAPPGRVSSPISWADKPFAVTVGRGGGRLARP